MNLGAIHGIMKSNVYLIILAIGGVSVNPASAVSSENVDEFYSGKTVNFIIPYNPGGGYDFYSRVAARHIGRHIPGQPTVVPQNMPGAGGFKAINYIYSVAPRDGSILGVPPASIALNDVLGLPGVEYKTNDFTWIGRISYSVDITFTWHTAAAKSVFDAMKEEVILAGAGAGSAGTINPRVLNYVVGTKFNVVLGYASSGDMMLAMERGETHGAYGSTSTLNALKPDWVRDNKVNILVQYTDQRYPEAPNVPSMVELGKTQEDKAILSLFATSALIGKSVLSTPDVPSDRTKALRSAFDAMTGDPKTIEEFERANVEFGPMSGEKLQLIFEEIASTPKPILERARAAYDATQRSN